MANIHVRDVPAEVVETLKARAARSGASLNTEIVRVLSDAAGRRTVDEILDAIDEIRKEHPPQMPWEEFIDLLHREEEADAGHSWREATRPREAE